MRTLKPSTSTPKWWGANVSRKCCFIGALRESDWGLSFDGQPDAMNLVSFMLYIWTWFSEFAKNIIEKLKQKRAILNFIFIRHQKSKTIISAAVRFRCFQARHQNTLATLLESVNFLIVHHVVRPQMGFEPVEEYQN
jgi:hypothetical protein